MEEHYIRQDNRNSTIAYILDLLRNDVEGEGSSLPEQ
jgi:hypothetical protein